MYLDLFINADNLTIIIVNAVANGSIPSHGINLLFTIIPEAIKLIVNLSSTHQRKYYCKRSTDFHL